MSSQKDAPSENPLKSYWYLSLFVIAMIAGAYDTQNLAKDIPSQGAKQYSLTIPGILFFSIWGMVTAFLLSLLTLKLISKHLHGFSEKLAGILSIIAISLISGKIAILWFQFQFLTMPQDIFDFLWTRIH